jgi:hypothetical protein
MVKLKTKNEPEEPGDQEDDGKSFLDEDHRDAKSLMIGFSNHLIILHKVWIVDKSHQGAARSTPVEW